MNATPRPVESVLWVRLNCRRCDYVYEAYEPSRDEIASPECSSCVIDRAFLPLEISVEKLRRLQARHRGIPVLP